MADNCCNSCDDLGIAKGDKGNDGSIIGAVTKVIVPSLNILTLNTTPFQLIAAPGIGKAIKLIEWSTSILFNSVVYAANTTLQVYINTANKIQGNDTVSLLSTLTRHINGNLIYVTNNTDTQLIANQPLMLNVLTGNPTLGNSDITLYIGYKIINL